MSRTIPINMTDGQCQYCNGIYSKAGMTRHLASCFERYKVLKDKAKKAANNANYFHILVEGKELPEYWMHLDVSANTTLRKLDDFLREIWLECCGHLSAFEIEGQRYDVYVEYWTDLHNGMKTMNYKLKDVLKPGMKFTHEYDFGTTTELSLRVLSEHEAPKRRTAVEVMDRNVLPNIRCCVCGKLAEQICMECVYYDEGYFCKECATEHPCGEQMMLPVLNSPRTGVCGYDGEFEWEEDFE